MLDYQIVNDHDRHSINDDVFEFWKKHNVLDEKKAKKRLNEVIGIVKSQNKLCGVCTAREAYLNDFQAHLDFVRRYLKTQNVGFRFLSFFNKFMHHIEENSELLYPQSIGIFLAVQNRKLNNKWKEAICSKTGFIYLGNFKKDYQMRVKYFKNSRLTH